MKRIILLFLLFALQAGNELIADVPTYNDNNSVTPSSGTGAVTPSVPAGVATNDILLCCVQSSNQAISVPTNSGAGAPTWTEVTNSPQSIGTAASAGAVRLAVFWLRYNGTSLGTVTVADSGNHTIARIQYYRGCITSGNPWDVTAGQTETGTTTTATFPSLTTTVSNTLIVFVAANAVDSNTSQATGMAANRNLTRNVGISGTETIVANSIISGNTNSGTGGGIDAGCGNLAAVGSTGTFKTSMTGSSANYAEMSIALKPPVTVDVAGPSRFLFFFP